MHQYVKSVVDLTCPYPLPPVPPPIYLLAARARSSRNEPSDAGVARQGHAHQDGVSDGLSQSFLWPLLDGADEAFKHDAEGGRTGGETRPDRGEETIERCWFGGAADGCFWVQRSWPLKAIGGDGGAGGAGLSLVAVIVAVVSDGLMSCTVGDSVFSCTCDMRIAISHPSSVTGVLFGVSVCSLN